MNPENFRKSNRFGISLEELIYDFDDLCCSTDPIDEGILSELCDTNDPYVEKVHRDEIAQLEAEIEKCAIRRKALREHVYQDFDSKLATHMANFKPKQKSTLLFEKFFTAFEQKQAIKLSSSDNARVQSTTECASNQFKPDQKIENENALTKYSKMVPSTSVPHQKKNVILDEKINSSHEQPSSSIEPKKVQDYIFGQALHSPKKNDEQSSMISVHKKAQNIVHVDENHSLRNDQQHSSVNTASQKPRRVKFADECSSTHGERSMATNDRDNMQVIDKSGHSPLKRTDSKITAVNSLLGMEIKKEIVEAQASRHKIPTNAGEKKSQIVMDNRIRDPEAQSNKPLLPFHEKEIIFAKNFEKNVAGINEQMKKLLKRTVREKVSLSSKKLASANEIGTAVRFFQSLLSGMTVYGFNDKMINLKGENQVMDWTMLLIIQIYIDLIKQDSELIDVVVSVLSALSATFMNFSSLLYGFLITQSPLLLLDHDECVRRINEVCERPDDIGEALTAWKSRELSIVRLFVALHIESNSRVSNYHNHCDVVQIWKITAAATNSATPFAAVLLAEAISQCKAVLRETYGKQFVKLMNLIESKILPYWKSVAEQTKGRARSIIEQYLNTLKFIVNE